MKNFFSSHSKFTTQLLDSHMLANSGILANNSDANLACGNNSHLAVKDNEKNQINANDKAVNPRKTSHSTPRPDDRLPLWVKNRKLLTRIFTIWVVLVIFMLLNVYHVLNVIE